MKMSIAAIAVALVYLVSLVTADLPMMRSADIATPNNMAMSTGERMQLAEILKEMMANNPDVDEAKFSDILARLAANPTAISHAFGAISAARSGDTGALAGHVMGLMGAAMAPAAAPATPTMVTPGAAAGPAMPMAPTYASTNAMAPAAATMNTAAAMPNTSA